MLRKTYLAIGAAICAWFSIAALSGWRAPNLGIVDGMTAPSGGSGYYYSPGGRGYGSSYGGWGGGK